MSDEMSDLPPELKLALAYTRPENRDAWRVFFEFDQRLARIVAATTETMLGQMRLAWWRDMLLKPPAGRPKGDMVLDAIATHWGGSEDAFVAVVDGWEVFLVAETLGDADLINFGQARAQPLVKSAAAAHNEAASRAAASRWALADAASRVSSDEERKAIVDVALRLEPSVKIQANLPKGLVVLDALAVRALRRGGRPLMEGRGASLTALRAGIFGR